MDRLARAIGLWWWSPLGRALTRARLRRSPARHAPTVADAIGRAHRGRFEDVEADWLRRIDALRRELGADDRALADVAGPGGGRDETDAAGADRSSVRDVYERASVSPERGRLLFTLVRDLRPRRCLEMGTGIGVSALYLAAALELNDGDGTLVTMEGSGLRAGVARRGLERLGVGDRVSFRVGKFVRTLPEVLDEGAFDIAFVDGHHKEGPTVDYVQSIVARAHGEVVLVLDDIAWSWGMRRAWRRIVTDERVVLSADVGPVGICVCAPRGKGEAA